jgi:hypothetical protein
MAADPGCVTLQVDWHNAFNTMRRDRMLAAVERRCPALLPMVAWAHGRHSSLQLQGSAAVVQSQSGVRQGDPLGPLLFAHLQGPLEEVTGMHPARPLAYADDTFLQGAPGPTMQAYRALTALAAPLGLHAQQTNGAVYSADDAAAAHIARHLKVRHAREGLLAAGNPVGTPAFLVARADICADHACQLLDKLQVLPLADQDRLLLLHGSLQRRVAHLPRGNQWQHVGQALQRAESKAVDGAFALLQQTRAEEPLTAQITLPLRHGGLGLACRPASAWLDTLPLTRTLELKSREVRSSLRHRLGLSMMPPNAPTLLCSCGAALNGNTADHAMRCSSLAALTTLRHDILKGILCRVVHWAGIGTAVLPLAPPKTNTSQEWASLWPVGPPN